jgi:hypothetical protein
MKRSGSFKQSYLYEKSTRMNTPFRVQIVGTQAACVEGSKDSWSDAADWAAGQLKMHFGDEVEVEYYDLFDPGCPPIPADVQLPLVIVEDEPINNGGKILFSVIQRKILSIMEEQTV